MLWIPSLLWYEVTNALIAAERRQRITAADGIQLRELYGMLSIKTDLIIGPNTIERLCTLAREYSLSAYDATYLELALRKRLRLATLDQNLQTAARKAGVRII
jgi:predicted nucleic acid-binding protein